MKLKVHFEIYFLRSYFVCKYSWRGDAALASTGEPPLLFTDVYVTVLNMRCVILKSGFLPSRTIPCFLILIFEILIRPRKYIPILF